MKRTPDLANGENTADVAECQDMQPDILDEGWLGWNFVQGISILHPVHSSPVLDESMPVTLAIWLLG